jgi:hypothetical protein
MKGRLQPFGQNASGVHGGNCRRQKSGCGRCTPRLRERWHFITHAWDTVVFGTPAVSAGGETFAWAGAKNQRDGAATDGGTGIVGRFEGW